MLTPILVTFGVGRRDVYKDMDENPERKEAYETAKRAREDVLLGEIVTIADDTKKFEDVPVAKLRMWGREKYLAMSNPARYGTKAEVTHKSATPLVVCPEALSAIVSPVVDEED